MYLMIGQDGFVVRTINTLSNPVTVTSELPLKLARKCVDVFGYASFDEDQATYILNPHCEDEIAYVAAGKEFMLLRTASGKLLYSGKGRCIGMRNNIKSSRWLEVSIGKKYKVSSFGVGHEGQHAILILDDGSVLFAGTARRGEDGDSRKPLFLYLTLIIHFWLLESFKITRLCVKICLHRLA
jgi:E3 ubiquitin-protein ligase MYCBP2